MTAQELNFDHDCTFVLGDSMTEKKQHEGLEALKGEIQRLREQVAELSAERAEGAPGKGEGDSHPDKTMGPLEELLHKFDSSREQGEKAVKDLAEEVERHPLVSVMAAFGLGYVVAKLFYHGGRR
jgi:ElaB/YqjD/DUF883 family membrane-anchored ribosome-binding protein